MATPFIVSFSADFSRFARTLDNLAKQQLPFAAAQALNETARGIAREITTAMPAIFDRPTPFTMRAIGVKAARKNSLIAQVFVKDAQARYLMLEETGGEREPEKTALVVPADITLNQYGGIPRGALKKLKGRGKSAVFVGTIKGVGGFWQRGPHHSIRLLAAFKSETRYKPRFGFRKRTEAASELLFMPALDRWLAKAIATAK